MLNISDISYSYGRKKPKVLDGFSLTLDSGGIYGLLGPNGAGKSTLLYLITGALTPQQGTVTLDGDDTSRRLPRTLSKIFIVPEEIKLPAMTLDKYIRLMAPFYPRFDMEIMKRCLDLFEMPYDVRLNSLSMGQKKKVFISFAFACDTPVMLMDEPTNGLDIPGKAAFRRLTAELMTDDRIIIISTHQVRDLDKLLDHVLIMNERNIIFSQPITEIQRRLSFGSGVSRAEAENALCSLPAPGGFDTMQPAFDDNGETEVNLELLFDFALHNGTRLNEIFSKHNA